MYSVNRVEDIYLLIFGYKCGVNRDMIEELSNFLLDFRVFVNKEFKYKSDADWCRLIRFYSSGDSHSIQLFAKVFKKYLDKKHIANSIEF